MSRSVYPLLAVAAWLVPVTLAASEPRAGFRQGPAVEGNRAPYDLVFSEDGRRAYVTEMAEGSVAEVDVPGRRVLRRFSTGGERPAGIALAKDGRALVVANSYSASVAILDPIDGVRRHLVRLPGEPHGVAVSPDGATAYVTLRQLDEVAVLDVRNGAVRGRVRVGRRPQALTLTPDGKTLTVGNLSGGSLSVIDTATLKEIVRVPLKGVNVRGLAFSASATGDDVYATLMPAFNAKSTTDPKEVWHNLVQAVTLDGENSSPAEDQWMDFARLPDSVEVVGTPDQHDIVVDAAGRHAWMAVSGRDVVTRITIRDRARNTVWPFSQLETPVGATPRGLALTPNGREVWSANYLGNSLTVVDAGSGARLADIDLGRASRVDPTILGQYLFNHAGMTRSLRFTCNSCHPDGASDGLSWNFVHVPDRFPRRNSRDLRTGVAETAPFRWSGYERHIETFIDDEVTGLLGGPKPTEAQRRALAAAVAAFRMPPNPYRNEDGTHTAAAERGKRLFFGRAGCSGCHGGPHHGGTGIAAYIGTTDPGLTVDVPQLEGVHDGAPYLHDGRAPTLESIFDRHNARRLHGRAHELTPEERADLLRYVREL